MYEARQNKEKICRTIDGGGMSRQRVKMENRRINTRLGNVLQCKIFMDNGIELSEPYIIYQQIQKEFMYPLQNGLKFAQILNRIYQFNLNMSLSHVIKALYDNPCDMNGVFLRIKIPKVIQNLQTINQGDINKEIKNNRIRNDKRISLRAQENYLNGIYGKTYIENLREQTRIYNMEKADAELQEGDYLQRNYTNGDFRGIGFYDIFFYDKYSFLTCYEHVLREVTEMSKDLVTSWYFNAENEDEIFATRELQSHSLRSELNPSTKTKSMPQDTKDNKTGRYFYSFIEHKDSEFNVNTRFTRPATFNGFVGIGGVKDGSGRRLQIPLKKMVKAHAVIMGGDLVDDRQEKTKMKLKQNSTPHKIFAPPRGLNGYVELQTMDLLQKYVAFVFTRIYLALNNSNAKSNAILTIYRLKSERGKDLWEDLTRNVAQPQLMTPNSVSLGMKDIKLDSSPIRH